MGITASSAAQLSWFESILEDVLRAILAQVSPRLVGMIQD